ncbi:hypothetical protein [Gulosibacter bifidus]|uniref:Uncharacterized protein n=1 Tax=Gulosibacter bifidus TaxID=272239 RepID=A0ABW5RJZ2_9MICO
MPPSATQVARTLPSRSQRYRQHLANH